MTSATMRTLRRHRSTGWMVLACLFLAAMPEAMARLFPASVWYELHSVDVGSGPDFDSLPVTASREIHRPFRGEYRVTVWPSSMVAPTQCKGGAPIDYQVVSARRIDVSAAWWIENQPIPCRNILHPGDYLMITCVEVHPASPLLAWLTDPRTCVKSNVFTLTARD